MIPGRGRFRGLGALLGVAVVAAGLLPGPSPWDAPAHRDDGLSGPAAPAHLSPAAGVGSREAESHGPEPRVRRVETGPRVGWGPTTPPGVRLATARDRGVLDPPHRGALARLRSGGAIHATTLPPPVPPRSGRRG